MKRMLLITGDNVMVNTDLDALVHLIRDEWDTVAYDPKAMPPEVAGEYDAVMVSLTSGISNDELAAVLQAAKPGRVFVKYVDIQFGHRIAAAFRTVPVTAIASLHPSIEGTAADRALRRRWMGQLHPDSRLAYSEFLAGLVHTIGPDIQAAADRAKAAEPTENIRAFYWGIRRPGITESLKALKFGRDRRDAAFGTVAAQFRRVRDLSKGLSRDEKFDLDSWAPYAVHAEQVLLPYEPVKSEYQITRRLLECAMLAGGHTVADARLSEHVQRHLDPAEWVTYAKQVSGELLEILDEGLTTVTSNAAKHGLDLGPQLADDRPKMLGTLQHVLNLIPTGTALEFGVGTGRSLRLIAEHMPVIGWDTWTGLPEDWRPGFGKGMFACDPPNVPGSILIPGLVQDTLPQWRHLLQAAAHAEGGIGLVHLDLDLESGTRYVLDEVVPLLKPGAYLVFDELHGWPDWESGGEWKAWTEYLAAHPVDYDVVGHGPEQWAIRLR